MSITNMNLFLFIWNVQNKQMSRHRDGGCQGLGIEDNVDDS